MTTTKRQQLTITALILLSACAATIGGCLLGDDIETLRAKAGIFPQGELPEGTACAVTFNINGGSGAIPRMQTVSGAVITLPSGDGLSRSGYAFSGWNTAGDGAGTAYDAGSSYTVTATVTLYAKWDVGYTVTFNANGGIGTVPDPMAASPGSVIRLPSSWGGLAKAGYIFGGWTTAPEGTGYTYPYYTVTADATLYAWWDTACTVTFNINGGSGTAPAPQTVALNFPITLPSGSGFFRGGGYTFDGWNTAADGTGTAYAAGSAYTVPGTVTLYAHWQEPVTNAPGATLAAKFAWLQSNAASGVSYTVEAGVMEDLGPTALSFSGITVTLKGGGAAGGVLLSSNGSMFTVGSGVTLVLEDITLYGRGSNNASLIRVNGGTLIMEDGSTVTGNSHTVSSSSSTSSTTGGGVSVYNNGIFTMNGGTISGNTASSSIGSTGGGVSVYNNGIFTMNGGTISDNTANNSGGGVYMQVGTFTMNGGTISGNSAFSLGSSNYSYGGGVYVTGFNGNTAIFTMSGGTISGNTASNGTASNGGGVYVGSDGRFTMSGDGTISGNTATANGGGVWVAGTLLKTGGTIYGSGEGSNSNTAASGRAVYGSGATNKRKETTAGPGDNLMYNGGASSGAWDN